MCLCYKPIYFYSKLQLIYFTSLNDIMFHMRMPFNKKLLNFVFFKEVLNGTRFPTGIAIILNYVKT